MRTPGPYLPALWRRLAQERLTFFLLTGGAVFLLGATWTRPQTIVAKQPKTSLLSKDAAREDALYRAALANGLGKDDPIIRRRLIQKMEFLFQDPGLVAPPADSELSAYLLRHADRYREAGRTAFSQVFFSKSRRGAAVTQDARRELAQLRSETHPAELTPELGDPFMLDYDFPAESAEEIASQFGAEFAQAVSAQAPGAWQGPLESVFGLHLVLVRLKADGRFPALAEVRDRVLLDFINEREKAASDRAYAEIRSHYQIVIQQESQ
jgi:peptidyl-prolyl cis-trans isomerase C